MNLTYTYRLKLTAAQQQRIIGWMGVCRLIWNMALGLKIDAYNKGLKVSFYDLEKHLTGLKDIPWIADVCSQSLVKTIHRLKLAYDSFFRKGGFPKFKSKKHDCSVPIKQDKTLNIFRAVSDTEFNLPKFGVVSVFKDRMPEGKILSGTIYRKSGKFYLTVASEVAAKPLPLSDSQAGVDVGISNFAVLSNGTVVEHPRLLEQSQRKLRVAQRKLQRAKKGGTNRQKQNVVVQKLHQKVTRQRTDFLHKLSSHIVVGNDLIAVEDLNVAGMKRSNLSAKISDSGWGSFRRMLAYKSEYYGRQFVAVNPSYTSQKCSECGHTEKDNRKTQSRFKCCKCGHEMNADHNAAINILRVGQTLLAQSTDSSLRLVKASNECQQ